MGWWSEYFLSCWLVLCQFLGLGLPPAGDEATKILAFQPTSVADTPWPDAYNCTIPIGIGEARKACTCADEDYQSWVASLKPSPKECNTKTTRQVWCKGSKPFHLCSNYENTLNKGFTVGFPQGVKEHLKITLEIAYGDIYPDGYPRTAMLINGTYPGPTIDAYWGQTVHVTVINKLHFNPNNPEHVSNGTALHPHGLRLWQKPQFDGVPGVTQCPIPPGGKFTYTWELHQYGTTWYHSHLSLQYPNGIVAPMIIHGPKSANYDRDLGAVVLTDWFHRNPFAIYEEELKRPQTPDSTLINGKGKFDCSNLKGIKCVETSYWSTAFVPNEWHLLRFVNTATSSTFRVSIDGHNMTIITTDFTAVRASEPVPYFDIAVGQRYEVLVYANYTGGDFWLRSEPLSCNRGTIPIKKENIARGIIRYDENSKSDPDSKSHLNPDERKYKCEDVNIDNLVPMFVRSGDDEINFAKRVANHRNFEVSLVAVNKNPSTQLARLDLEGQTVLEGPGEPSTEKPSHIWKIWAESMKVDWSKPALSLFELGANVTAYPKSYAVIEATASTGGSVNQVVFHINGTIIPGIEEGVMHPIHIHGHDFVVLAQGSGNFHDITPPKKLYNPVRRDVATMPGDGYLVISFPVDNEGVWLLHCHLAWHASQGLALLISERPSHRKSSRATRTLDREIRPMVNDDLCDQWSTYLATASPSPSPMDDSGV